jgi:hypothetical protein
MQRFVGTWSGEGGARKDHGSGTGEPSCRNLISISHSRWTQSRHDAVELGPSYRIEDAGVYSDYIQTVLDTEIKQKLNYRDFVAVTSAEEYHHVHTEVNVRHGGRHAVVNSHCHLPPHGSDGRRWGQAIKQS